MVQDVETKRVFFFFFFKYYRPQKEREASEWLVLSGSGTAWAPFLQLRSNLTVLRVVSASKPQIGFENHSAQTQSCMIFVLQHRGGNVCLLF